MGSFWKIGSGGNIELTNYGSGHNTGISAAALTDGGTHRISLSWDGNSPTSEYVIYIDGVEVGRGTHPRQHWQINTDGTLIFGQEQDAIGGGFQE